MRLLVLSDLHIEAAGFEPVAGDYDAVVLAGDIGNGVAAITWARAAFSDKPVIYVPGNHEAYGGVWGETEQEMASAAREAGVHFLQQGLLELNGVRFLGTTLWTDFRWFERPRAEGSPQLTVREAQAHCQRLLADFRAIAVRETPNTAPSAQAPHDSTPPPYRHLTPDDVVAAFERQYAWLRAALETPYDGPTVVVTHHLPSGRSIAPRYQHAATNPGFVSDCEHLLALADVWIHGHTHVSCRYHHEGCEVICNPRGYPKRRQGFENPAFDPQLTVNVQRV